MAWWKEFDKYLRPNEPLAARTWLRIGGAAEFYAEPPGQSELQKIIKRCRDEGIPIHLLGGGSNILVRDVGVTGLVLHLTETAFGDIKTKGTTVTAGSGAKLGHLISTVVREGLGGLETLVGIPGTVGGALRGNAGGRGGDIGQWADKATVITRDGEIVERPDLVFSYRQSNLDELVILGAEFHLEKDDPEALTRRMQVQWITKRGNQPLAHQSAGCIFKNPRGISAGMLIDQSGLKGTKIGGAEVSDRHANFIITESGASSDDVLRLIELIQTKVAERQGVDLELEIEIW